METVYKTILEKQNESPISLKTHNELRSINNQILKEAERKTLEHLISITEIYRLEAENAKTLSTKDNHYSDIYPYLRFRYETSNNFLQTLYRFEENQ